LGDEMSLPQVYCIPAVVWTSVNFSSHLRLEEGIPAVRKGDTCGKKRGCLRLEERIPAVRRGDTCG